MVAAWKATWGTFLVMVLTPSTRALVLQHNEAGADVPDGIEALESMLAKLKDRANAKKAITAETANTSTAATAGVSTAAVDTTPVDPLVFHMDPVMQFNGNDIYSIPGSPANILTSAYTLMAWVNPSQRTADDARIVGRGSSDIRNYGLWIMTSGIPVSQMTTNTARWSIYDPVGPIVPLNQWTHLASTHVPGGMHKLYMNGSLVASSTTTGAYTWGTYFPDHPLTLGYASDGQALWKTGFIGQLRDARVYNVATSAEDVQNAFGGQAPTSPTSAPTSSPTPTPTPSPTASPTLAPTSSPTISPTSAPTPSPTPSPTASPTSAPTTSAPTAAPINNGPMVAGVGDPHLVNTHGQKFDLFHAGYHTLINIPRWARQRTNFLVQARASRAGAGCADLYFTEINISGTWAQRHKAADLRWVAEAATPGKAKWMKFHNKISVKIVHGHTAQSTKYLNILVKGLDKTKAPVGGLLGEDDHTAAATPDVGCKKLLTL